MAKFLGEYDYTGATVTGVPSNVVNLTGLVEKTPGVFILNEQSELINGEIIPEQLLTIE